MDFREYAKGIKFSIIQPDEKPHMLEVRNTYIPEGNADKWLALADLCAIPRMSTFAIACLINKAIHDMPPGQCFVNVGVWHGFTFLAGMLGNPDKHCIGVDNFTEFGGPRDAFRQRFLDAHSPEHHFYDMDYKQYFAEFHQGRPIGFYIYDGAHDYQNQIDGLTVAEPFLADGALVMIDDWNWPATREATKDFIKQSANCWEVVLEEFTSGNGHPDWWNGLFIMQKHGPKATP